jgi:hypothetical protein
MKGCIVWSFIIYTACQILGCERAVALLVVRNVACMGLEWIFDWKTGRKESIQKICVEYGRIILKWILWNLSEWNLTVLASGE